MARVNVYLPDDLAAEAKAAGLNVSALAQDAIRGELRARRTATWWDDLRQRRDQQSTGAPSRAQVRVVMDQVREEWWGE